MYILYILNSDQKTCERRDLKIGMWEPNMCVITFLDFWARVPIYKIFAVGEFL